MSPRLVAALAALPLLLVGCRTTSSSTGATQMTGHDTGPSETASMICGPEIRAAVAHTLRVDRAPRGVGSWTAPRYRCRFGVGAGELRLSVEDLDSAAPGRAYFNRLRTRLPRPSDLGGLESFGFPSFETARGDVVFLKDHKTLWVDASRLGRVRIPSGMSRTDVAYGVAAAVIACWTE